MKAFRMFRIFFLQWTFIAGVTGVPMPRLPGLYHPEYCLPMTDHSYPGDPDGDLSQEVIITNWNQDTLFCKRGCCGDSKQAECCLPEPEEGLGAFELISIVAAGIAGVTVITVTSLYFIKQHNKNKVLVHDISSINKKNAKGVGASGGTKAGSFNKTVPDFTVKSNQTGGELFRKSNKSPSDMKRPKTPISMVSPPDILPTILAGPATGGIKPSAPKSHSQLPGINNPTLKPVRGPVQQLQPDLYSTNAVPPPAVYTLTGPSYKQSCLDDNLPGTNETPRKVMEAPKQGQTGGHLIADLKAPSPPCPSGPAPSPPLPDNLPPPLISAPFRTANVDDEFIDSILASIPMEDNNTTTKY